MSGDPIDGQAAQLLALARKESPSEATRRRILEAVRAPASTTVTLKSSRFSGSRLWAPVALAAAALCIFLFQGSGRQFFDISAEPVATNAARGNRSGTILEKESSSEDIAARPEPLQVKNHAERPRASPAAGEERVLTTLQEELASVQKVRAALARGEGANALSELNGFERKRGFRKLGVEASLLRIEALAQTGRTSEAREEARRFVEKHPNDPLVDRAKKFAQPTTDHPLNSEGN